MQDGGFALQCPQLKPHLSSLRREPFTQPVLKHFRLWRCLASTSVRLSIPAPAPLSPYRPTSATQ